MGGVTLAADGPAHCVMDRPRRAHGVSGVFHVPFLRHQNVTILAVIPRIVGCISISDLDGPPVPSSATHPPRRCRTSSVSPTTNTRDGTSSVPCPCFCCFCCCFCCFCFVYFCFTTSDESIELPKRASVPPQPGLLRCLWLSCDSMSRFYFAS